MVNQLNNKFVFPVIVSVLVLGGLFIPQTAYACDFVTHPERCTKELVDDIIKKTVDPVLRDLDKEIIRVENDAEKDFRIVENDVKSLESELVKEIKTIEKDVVKIVDDAESIEGALVNDVVKDVKIIKEDIKKITNFVETVDKDIERTISAAERLEKILAHDILTYYLYIGIAAIVLVAILVGIRIYEIVMKHIEKNRFYKLEENVAELVKLVSRLVTNNKTKIEQTLKNEI